MADRKDYSGVTPAALETLRGELKSMGITVPDGNSGEIDYQGVKLAINYSPPDQELSVHILQKPLFIPESLVWQLLDARVQKSIGA